MGIALSASLARQKLSATTATPLVTGTAAMIPRRPEIYREIVGFELAAEHRAIGGGGVGHARQARVDAEARGARDLERRVDALQALADKLVLIWRLDRRLGRQRDLRRVGRKFTESRRAPGGLVPHHAAARAARGRRDAPPRRRRRDEPRAGRGARLLQEHPRAAHRPGAAGPHRLIDIVVGKVAVGGGVLDFHLREVAFQLLGENHRERGQRALPHLRFGDAQRDGIVGVDDDEGVDLVGRLAGLRAPWLAGETGRARELGSESRDRKSAGGRKTCLNE